MTTDQIQKADMSCVSEDLWSAFTKAAQVTGTNRSKAQLGNAVNCRYRGQKSVVIAARGRLCDFQAASSWA